MQELEIFFSVEGWEVGVTLLRWRGKNTVGAVRTFEFLHVVRISGDA